ncbi:MAG TPA: hypothetical protein VNW29_05800 [Candidatus Sulfotelmatobacter sp.]|jgi:transposase|nr:hypothetical protein [Candidatus Sulfotelmatobacter sp.]
MPIPNGYEIKAFAPNSILFVFVKLCGNTDDKDVVLPKWWIVERTNTWISRYQRLAKDFERLSKTVRTWIFLAMTRQVRYVLHHSLINQIF